MPNTPNILEVKEIQLLPPTGELTRTEMDIIAECLTNPSVKKYLNTLLWNNIIDHSNIPLPQLAVNPQEYAIKQAFVKGHIGCITDLLSIEKAPKTQASNQQRRNDNG